MNMYPKRKIKFNAAILLQFWMHLFLVNGRWMHDSCLSTQSELEMASGYSWRNWKCCRKAEKEMGSIEG